MFCQQSWSWLGKTVFVFHVSSPFGTQVSYIRIFKFISTISQLHVSLEVSPHWRSSLCCVKNQICTSRITDFSIERHLLYFDWNEVCRAWKGVANRSKVARCPWAPRTFLNLQSKLVVSLIIQVPRGPLVCRALQSYYSPSDWARELFKPSTDSASLVVEIKKTFFRFRWGFSGGNARSGGGVGHLYLALDPNHWAIFMAQDFVGN